MKTGVQRGKVTCYGHLAMDPEKTLGGWVGGLGGDQQILLYWKETVGIPTKLTTKNTKVNESTQLRTHSRAHSSKKANKPQRYNTQAREQSSSTAALLTAGLENTVLRGAVLCAGGARASPASTH